MEDAEKKKLLQELKADEVHINPMIDGAINHMDADHNGIPDVPFIIHQVKAANKAIEPYKPVFNQIKPLIAEAAKHIDAKGVIADLEKWVAETKQIKDGGRPAVLAVLKMAAPSIEKAIADLAAFHA